jgi:predicted dehydrogenase
MSNSIHRRHFLGAAAAAGVGLGLNAATNVLGANEKKLVVGIMGTGGRGTEHAKSFAKQANVEVAYVCDVDKNRAGKAAEEVNKIVSKAAGKAPQAVQDFRKILDDKAVDVVVVATCNHWHAPAAILACTHGKHVYVEKPCSHNAHEGELMVEAARKNNCRVQMGNQRRSWPKIIEAIQQVRDGVIGRAYFAQAWYLNTRPSIGKGQSVAAPAGLDYDLWQGPAPRKPFRSNYLHYNWHWFWHWGNGELGNNGIHYLDLCRWGLGVEYPTHVTSIGGRYRWEDDQETPDTNVVTFNFADHKSISWEGLSCSLLPAAKVPDVIFHGEKGTLALNSGGYTIYDEKGKEVKKETGAGGDVVHIGNFLDAIRNEKATLNSEITEGHKSTLLCHLGNIAYRVGRALNCDPKSGHIVNDKEAAAQWTREYEKGWEPKV